MLTIFSKRSVLDVYWVLNMPLDDTSRLDRSSKCVLLRKPSYSYYSFSNNSKSKENYYRISHTVFVTFINNYSLCQRFYCGLFEPEIMKKLLLEHEVVYSGSFKCTEVFFLKIKKKSKKCQTLDKYCSKW